MATIFAPNPTKRLLDGDFNILRNKVRAEQQRIVNLRTYAKYAFRGVVALVVAFFSVIIVTGMGYLDFSIFENVALSLMVAIALVGGLAGFLVTTIGITMPIAQRIGYDDFIIKYNDLAAPPGIQEILRNIDPIDLFNTVRPNYHPEFLTPVISDLIRSNPNAMNYLQTTLESRALYVGDVATATAIAINDRSLILAAAIEEAKRSVPIERINDDKDVIDSLDWSKYFYNTER